jgi:hypothetical protein
LAGYSKVDNNDARSGSLGRSTLGAVCPGITEVRWKLSKLLYQSLNRSALGGSTYGSSSGSASGLGVDSIEAQRRMMECDQVIKVRSFSLPSRISMFISYNCPFRD